MEKRAEGGDVGMRSLSAAMCDIRVSRVWPGVPHQCAQPALFCYTGLTRPVNCRILRIRLVS
jgi:hypothetical protein